MRESRLALEAEEIRAIGHRTVDLLAELLTAGSAPALRRASPEEMAERIPGGAPERPQAFDTLLDQLSNDVLPYMSRLDHPGYFAFIPACGTFPAALGDLIASALNIYTGSWMESAGPSRLELVVLDWFKQWIGFDPQAAGILVSGGSAANMTALACARESLVGPMDDRVVAYVSDQAHASLARAARLLGFRPDQVRVLPTDGDRRLRPETLASAIDADVAAGRRPLFASASAGATNTGAVDPLDALAAVCRERGLWFHVDGAYGAFAALTERGRAVLGGIEQADSLTLDPHKWLYQPFECGALLVRDGGLLRHAFEIVPEYLADAEAGQEEVNFSDLGLQLSRGSRALKVWLSISFFGLDAFRGAIDRSLDLALAAERRVLAAAELELLSPATLGIVCFRRRGAAGDDEEDVAEQNAALVEAWEATGRGLVSSTRLHGRFAVRLCPMNHTSREQDVADVLDFFAHTRGAVSRHAALQPQHQRHTVLEPGDLESLRPAAADAARADLFAGLGAKKLGRLAARATERRLGQGEAVIRRWDAGRDFYVLLEGTAAVMRDEERLAELGAGDFFGELAAADWGAGYGYARLATVIATSPVRLLSLTPEHLAELMHEEPAIAARVRAAARDRLAGLEPL